MTTYSDDDLDDAVAQNIISAEDADRLRAYVARRRAEHAGDGEPIKLPNTMNDVAVALSVAIVVVGLGGGLAATFGSDTAFVILAAGSWMMSIYFTEQRRMLLPGILALAIFAASVGGLGATAWNAAMREVTAHPVWPGGSIVGLAAAGIAAGFHWRRFKLAVTPGLIAAIGFVGLNRVMDFWLIDDPVVRFGAAFAFGTAVFAFGLRWDLSAGGKTGWRSDVAFWLHLAAAPMLVHSGFKMLLALDLGLAWPVSALALYALLTWLALCANRRAIPMAGLVYLLYATWAALGRNATSDGFFVTLLLVGSGLLVLSIWWAASRRLALSVLPGAARTWLPA